MSTNSSPRPGDVYLNFNGRNAYVEIPSLTDYSVSTTGKLTIAAWMRPDTLNPTFPGYRSCWSRSSVPGGSAATKFDRSRLVDSQNGKMLGPAGPKLAALCSSRRTSAVVGCGI